MQICNTEFTDLRSGLLTVLHSNKGNIVLPYSLFQLAQHDGIGVYSHRVRCTPQLSGIREINVQHRAAVEDIDYLHCAAILLTFVVGYPEIQSRRSTLCRRYGSLCRRSSTDILRNHQCSVADNLNSILILPADAAVYPEGGAFTDKGTELVENTRKDKHFSRSIFIFTFNICTG